MSQMHIWVYVFILVTLSRAIDVDISNHERNRDTQRAINKEYRHSQQLHLDEAALLKNEVKESERKRLLVMLIAIPATVIPACCLLFFIRRIWVAKNSRWVDTELTDYEYDEYDEYSSNRSHGTHSGSYSDEDWRSRTNSYMNSTMSNNQQGNQTRNNRRAEKSQHHSSKSAKHRTGNQRKESTTCGQGGIMKSINKVLAIRRQGDGVKIPNPPPKTNKTKCNRKPRVKNIRHKKEKLGDCRDTKHSSKYNEDMDQAPNVVNQTNDIGWNQEKSKRVRKTQQYKLTANNSKFRRATNTNTKAMKTKAGSNTRSGQRNFKRK